MSFQMTIQNQPGMGSNTDTLWRPGKRTSLLLRAELIQNGAKTEPQLNPQSMKDYDHQQLLQGDIKELLTNAMLLESFHMRLHVSPRQNTTMYGWMQSFHTPIELVATQSIHKQCLSWEYNTFRYLNLEHRPNYVIPATTPTVFRGQGLVTKVATLKMQ